jgi:hypothetical protein
MLSSFLIKNHGDANFDNYLLMMKKRKTLQAQNLNTSNPRECDSPTAVTGKSPTP